MVSPTPGYKRLLKFKHSKIQDGGRVTSSKLQNRVTLQQYATVTHSEFLAIKPLETKRNKKMKKPNKMYLME